MTNNPLILIAEDDEDDFIILHSAFEAIQLPVNIQRVENGLQVFQYLDGVENTSSFPDLILLDMNLPKLGGEETLFRLKTNDLYKNIPVIIHTSVINEAQKEKCLQNGVAAFLQKASHFGEMLSHVRFFISCCTNHSLNM